ncbi:MAG: LemA family protein [Mediterraneibacter sp.]|nr:LemA family protein [Candidatus Mediterraneibacter caccogallinarum]
MWLQKIPFIVKLFLYLIIIFFMGAVFAGVISLMFEPEAEEASAWVFTAGYVLSIVIALAGGVSVENNGLHKIREQAMAMKSNINVIRGRIDNILFQLDPIVENQMNHEKEIYLKVSRNEAKKYRHLKSLGEVKASLSAYPVLRSDETVMRLFSQIVKEYEELANAKMAYNGYASQYNAGIKSFPVVLFRALSREGALEYYEDPTDENIM